MERDVLKPTGDRIVVEVLEWTSTGRSMIITPDQSKEQTRGRVLAVGPGELHRYGADPNARLPLDVKVGDIVQFGRYAGADEFKYNITRDGKNIDVKVKIMRSEEIWCSVEQETVSEPVPETVGAAV